MWRRRERSTRLSEWTKLFQPGSLSCAASVERGFKTRVSDKAKRKWFLLVQRPECVFKELRGSLTRSSWINRGTCLSLKPFFCCSLSVFFSFPNCWFRLDVCASLPSLVSYSSIDVAVCRVFLAAQLLREDLFYKRRKKYFSLSLFSRFWNSQGLFRKCVFFRRQPKQVILFYFKIQKQQFSQKKNKKNFSGQLWFSFASDSF